MICARDTAPAFFDLLPPCGFQDIFFAADGCFHALFRPCFAPYFAVLYIIIASFFIFAREKYNKVRQLQTIIDLFDNRDGSSVLKNTLPLGLSV
jgi:hypothetical protein